MADREKNTGDFRVVLKHLENYDNLQLADIAKTLVFCRKFFANNPREQIQQRINIPFFIENFPGSEFTLRSSQDIENYENKITEVEADEALSGEQKNKLLNELRFARDSFISRSLFMSDMVNFTEEAYNGLYQYLSQDGRIRFKEPPNDVFVFANFTRQNNEITLNELENLEKNPDAWRALADHGQKIIDIADKDLETTTAEAASTATEDQTEDNQTKKILSAAASIRSSDDIDNEGDVGTDESQEELHPDEKRPPEKRKDQDTQTTQASLSEFNLASLDDRSKLYMRSMAIVTINQSLQKLDPNGQLTFDQLDPQARQQLMSIAFGKVETLLASGQFNLEDVIKQTSSRINLAQEASLDLLIDIRGSRILAEQAKTVLNTQTNFENKAINPQDIKERLKIDANNPEIANFSGVAPNISTAGAADFFSQLDGDDTQKAAYIDQLSLTLGSVSDQKLVDILSAISQGEKGSENTSFLVKTNIIPAIQTLIQQGYPAEYVKNLSPQQFAFYFGEDAISKATFTEFEGPIKQVLESYWRSKRANWSGSIRREASFEFYSNEDAQNIWNNANSSRGNLKHHKEQFLKQSDLNNRVGGDIVTRVIAGEEIGKLNLTPQEKEQLLAFKKKYNKAYLDMVANSSRTTQEIVYTFYYPGGTVPEGELDWANFQGFSPYDLYGINANAHFGEGRFARGANGAFMQAQNLYDRTLGKGVDFLGEKGVEAGLSYLTGGAYAALPQPVKDFINNLAFEELKKYIEPILKALAFVSGLLFAALLKFLSNFSGLFKLFGTNAGKNAVTGQLGVNKLGEATTLQNVAQQQALQAAQASQASSTTGIGAGPVLGNMAKNAMATASQAVIATVTITTVGTFVYKMTVNNAFLTDFPKATYGTSAPMNESEYLKIEKELEGKEHYENAEVAGGIDLLYTITITPNEGEIKILELNDEVSIRSKGNPPEPEIERVGDEEIPETIDEPLELEYQISGIDSAYADTAITNQITIKAVVGTIGEIEELSDSAMVKIGTPPVPAGVALAKLIVETLRSCAGGFISQGNLSHAEECLRNAGVPEESISQMSYSTSQYEFFQCVGFARSLLEIGGVPGVPKAGDWCGASWPGFSAFSSPSDWDPYLDVGDYVIQGGSGTGHIAYVIDRVGDQVTIAEAMGNNGEVRFRTIGIATFASNWCTFFKPN